MLSKHLYQIISFTIIGLPGVTARVAGENANCIVISVDSSNTGLLAEVIHARGHYLCLPKNTKYQLLLQAKEAECMKEDTGIMKPLPLLLHKLTCDIYVGRYYTVVYQVATYSYSAMYGP